MFEWTPLADAAQMSEIDRLSEEKYQINPETLMESAGAVTAKKILSSNDFNTQQVMILCGPGNNGGDGLVAGRYLLSSGIKTDIFCPKESNSPLIQKQKEKLKNHNLYSIEDLEQIKQIGEEATLVIDALFGIGLSKNIKGVYFKIIEWLNSKKQIISLDVPSGLDCNTGQVKGIAVKAHHTFTFELAKPGFYLSKGPSHTGKLSVLSIGFPNELILEKANSYFLINESWVSSKLPQRKIDDHKAKQGHLLILAGHEGFWGAGQLASLSAYRMGAGYVTWAGRGKNPSLDSVPEVLTKNISENLFENKTAVVIGPGLGVHPETKNLLLELKKQKLPVLVDADAFTVCVQENLFPLPSNWVVTPHSGELARLFGLKGEDIDQDRILFAKKAFQKIGALVLLKGLHSILVDQDKCFIIPTGNSALAKAGTGDVLSGFIGALMARSLSTFNAASVGAFIHGKLADEWVHSGRDADTLMAQDLKDLLPILLKKLRVEDIEDIKAVRKRKKEPSVDFDTFVKKLKKDGKV
ncbi:MAG: NAD(P)H-hydrate dehydratase [Bdellovibrionales bacterium]|nr:NAD(P)H-hydrate dehydratase [Bdellovibrionales bacterium]